MTGINLLPDLASNNINPTAGNGINLLPDLVKPSQEKRMPIDALRSASGVDRTPLSILRDVAGGAAGQLQKIASGMGELGQGVAGTFTNVPRVDIREEMGLRGDNQVDLNKIIQSENPNPTATFTGEMLPGVLTGGTSIPGQIITNIVANTAAASPDQENLTGYLPQGRPGALIENTVAGLLGGYVAPKVIGGTIAAGKYAKDAFRKIDPKKMISKLQSSHDVLENESSKLYNFVKDEVKFRGIKDVPISSNLIDQVEYYLPRTKQNIALIKKARSGDYDAIHTMQSDLGKRGQKMKSSTLGADRDQGELMLDLRQEINNNTHDFFEKTMNYDLSDALGLARDKFKELKDIYYGYNPITRVVGELRKLPKNPMTLLGEDSAPIKKLLNEHPDIKRDVETYLKRQKSLTKVKQVGKFGFTIGGLGLGGKAIKDLFD